MYIADISFYETKKKNMKINKTILRKHMIIIVKPICSITLIPPFLASNDNTDE